MTAYPEARFTRKFCDKLVQCNCDVVAIVGMSPYQRAGLPDRWACGKDMPGVWLEFKWEDAKLNALQQRTMTRWMDHGVPCLVVRGWYGMAYLSSPRDGQVVGVTSFWPSTRGPVVRDAITDALKVLSLMGQLSKEITP